ncbi:hypothetical protein AB0I28_32230 [Phytomonospora sp. NPDC050363]|uniref:hypothetical protein n=1 Tax=Phytomonospora sp. NPDC050363 TaxID=3155642 RepID=UPI0033F2BC1E
MGWVRRWRIEVVIETRLDGRRERRWVRAASVAEVRRLVERARADRAVVAWRLGTEHVLDEADRPKTCPACAGELEPLAARHAATGQSRSAKRLACRACPGHVRITCAACEVPVVWPAATIGCGSPRSRWETPPDDRPWTG